MIMGKYKKSGSIMCRTTANGCVVTGAAFVAQFIVEGIFMSFTVFYAHIVEHFGTTISEVSMIGSMAYGGWFLVAPLASKVVEAFGAGMVVTVAGTISTAALFCCSLATSLWHLTICFGVIVGICFGFVYLPAFTISSYYVSHKWQHFAAVFATVGGAVGGVTFPQIFALILEEESWRFAFVITAGIVFHLIICGSLFRCCEAVKLQYDNSSEKANTSATVEAALTEEIKPYHTDELNEEPKRSEYERGELTRSNNCCGYTLGGISDYYYKLFPFLVSNLFWNAGYFAILTLLPLYMSHLGITDGAISTTFSMGCVGIAAGRVATAAFAAWQPDHSIAYYNLVTLAAAATALPFALIKGSFFVFVILNAIYGFFFGSQVAITPSAVLSYVGLENMDHGVGLLLFATGLGGVTGPIAVGVLQDALHSYPSSFFVAFGFSMLGFLVMMPSALLNALSCEQARAKEGEIFVTEKSCPDA